MVEPSEQQQASEPESASNTEAGPRRWPWIVLAAAVLAGVVLFLGLAEDVADVETAVEPSAVRPVTVEAVSVGSHRVEVAAYAEVRPRWSAELRAAISGRVTAVLDSALVGEQVETGTPLVRIEASRYAAELAAARLALKQTRLALWQAKNAHTVARKTFTRSGKTPPNDLAVKLPQLQIATRAVESAQERVLAARQQLKNATVVAPFSGFVTDRFVSPGQSVGPGDRLLALVDDRTFELTVTLGAAQWRLLEHPLADRSARIVTDKGETITDALIRRSGGFLDPKTRQYKIFLEIRDAAASSVLSGDFVRVILPGITVPAALDIPASALTREGHVWLVTKHDRLRRITARVLFHRGDRVVIAAPDGSDALLVATTPLAAFLPGLPVRPLAREG